MTVIGFVGLGRMGLPMPANLLDKGFAVVGCDLDPERTAVLAAKGATVARTPADAARQADITLSIIMNDAVLRAVALGSDGVLAGTAPGRIYADLSTVSPAASAEVGAAARTRGVGYLCAKVAGSVGLAESGGLTLFASGDADHFDRCRPAFAAMAAQVLHVGAGGTPLPTSSSSTA